MNKIPAGQKFWVVSEEGGLHLCDQGVLQVESHAVPVLETSPPALHRIFFGYPSMGIQGIEAFARVPGTWCKRRSELWKREVLCLQKGSCRITCNVCGEEVLCKYEGEIFTQEETSMHKMWQEKLLTSPCGSTSWTSTMA